MVKTDLEGCLLELVCLAQEEAEDPGGNLET